MQSLAAATAWLLSQEIGEFVGCEVGLAQDCAERAGGKVAVAVDRDDDQWSAVGFAQVVVAAADVGLFIAGAP